MFHDDRVDLKRSRDYSSLNESRASKSDRRDRDWEDEDNGTEEWDGPSSQEKTARKESWGGFFGSTSEKSAAQRLAEIRAARERMEQEKARKEVEKLRADRVAASKKASVSSASSGASHRSGSVSGPTKAEAMRKVQELEKHSRAQMLKQARDFSDLLGNGPPKNVQTLERTNPRETPMNRRGPAETNGRTGQRVPDNAKQKPPRKPEPVARVPKPPAPRAVVTPKPGFAPKPVPKPAVEPKQSDVRNGRKETDRKEAPPKNGMTIAGLATMTPDGALVANRGLSLDEAKRLKKGAKLLGLKLYFETEEKARLKREKLALEAKLTAGNGAREKVPVGKGTGGSVGKGTGSGSGGVPRSLDEERRRANGNAAQRKPDIGKSQSNGYAKPASASKPTGRDPPNVHRNGGGNSARDLGRGGGFPAFKGPLKRKRPEEEMEDADSFLDEGDESDGEGPSQEAVSSMIRKMFRYDPHKYVTDDRDDRSMEVGFKRMQAEEMRSARIAREEDEREAERLDLEERRREEKRRKKAGSKSRFVDD